MNNFMTVEKAQKELAKLDGAEIRMTLACLPSSPVCGRLTIRNDERYPLELLERGGRRVILNRALKVAAIAEI